ncbi:hypothetical protein [Lysinibacillus sp. NPDC093688]
MKKVEIELKTGEINVDIQVPASIVSFKYNIYVGTTQLDRVTT